MAWIIFFNNRTREVAPYGAPGTCVVANLSNGATYDDAERLANSIATGFTGLSGEFLIHEDVEGTME